jgi:hypothetical protein
MIKSTVFIFVLFTVAAAQPNAAGSGECRPEIPLDSILDSVRVEGGLRMGPIEGRCLPVERRPGSSYAYEPRNGRKFTSTLRDSKGRTVNVFAWYGTPRVDGVRFDRYEIVGGEAALETLRDGSYAIDFAVDGRVFQSFAFALKVKESRDAFRPGKIYLTDGAWRDQALLTGSATSVACFQFRLRADDETAAAVQVKVPYSVKLIRSRDASVLAETREGQLSLDSNWHSFRTCLGAPAGARNGTEPLKLGDLLANDGLYRIVLSIDGRAYAQYDLNVTNGRFNGDPPGRSYRIKLAARRIGK